MKLETHLWGWGSGASISVLFFYIGFVVWDMRKDVLESCRRGAFDSSWINTKGIHINTAKTIKLFDQQNKQRDRPILMVGQGRVSCTAGYIPSVFSPLQVRMCCLRVWIELYVGEGICKPGHEVSWMVWVFIWEKMRRQRELVQWMVDFKLYVVMS